MAKINLPRGTSLTLLVKTRTPDGEPYMLEDDDILLFGIKRFPEHKNYIVIKEFSKENYNSVAGGYLIELLPEDTENFVFDNYYYDVSVQLANGKFYQIIPTSILSIEKTITKKKVTE